MKRIVATTRRELISHAAEYLALDWSYIRTGGTAIKVAVYVGSMHVGTHEITAARTRDGKWSLERALTLASKRLRLGETFVRVVFRLESEKIFEWAAILVLRNEHPFPEDPVDHREMLRMFQAAAGHIHGAAAVLDAKRRRRG